MIAGCLGGNAPEMICLHHWAVKLADVGIPVSLIGIACLCHWLTHDFPAVVVEQHKNTIDRVLYEVKLWPHCYLLIEVIGISIGFAVLFGRFVRAYRTSIMPSTKFVNGVATDVVCSEVCAIA